MLAGRRAVAQHILPPGQEIVELKGGADGYASLPLETDMQARPIEEMAQQPWRIDDGVLRVRVGQGMPVRVLLQRRVL